VFDSGCTQHMTDDSRMFNSIKSNDGVFKVSHLVIIAKARSRGLVKLLYLMI
jgi:hypothetical protein